MITLSKTYAQIMSHKYATNMQQLCKQYPEIMQNILTHMKNVERIYQQK